MKRGCAPYPQCKYQLGKFVFRHMTSLRKFELGYAPLTSRIFTTCQTFAQIGCYETMGS
jgi:hypothetical protein